MNINDYSFSDPFIVDIDSDLEGIVPRFLSNTVLNVEKLDEFLTSGEMGEFKKLCHTLKGVCGGYGLEDLSLIARYLEDEIDKGSKNTLQKGISLMRDYLKNMQINYTDAA